MKPQREAPRPAFRPVLDQVALFSGRIDAQAKAGDFVVPQDIVLRGGLCGTTASDLGGIAMMRLGRREERLAM